jgi:phospholipid transport system substrate-binding protein
LFKKLVPGILAASLFPFFPNSGEAGERAERAQALVVELSGDAKAVLSQSNAPLAEREDQLAETIRDGFQIKFIGKFVVGPDWEKMTDAQRNDFIELFEDFYLKAYSSHLGGYPQDELIIVSAFEKGSKDSFVVTKLKRPKRKTVSVRWRVRENEQTPQIIDIVIDGTSVALTHRKGFDRVLQADGIEGLISLLRIRAERLSAQPSG